MTRTTILCCLLPAVYASAVTAAAQSFALTQTFDDPSITGGDFFGRSVAIDGGYLLVGASGDDTRGSDVGQAYLFDAETGGLLQTFNDPSPTGGDAFGLSVAIDGDNVLVGAWGDDSMGVNAGQAYLFDATTGSLLRTFNNPSPNPEDQFGLSVAIDGENVLIGSYRDDTIGTNVGQAHLFDLNTGSLLRSFNDPTPTNNDQFGYSVAIDGDNVLVGSFLDDTQGFNRGQAHLFDASTGSLLQTFNDPTPTSSDQFGVSVAIHGSSVLVGASLDDTRGNNTGQAYLFDATTGGLLQTFNDPTPTGSNQFGFSVAIEGDSVLVGAFGDDSTGSNRGQAHLFDAATGNLLHTFNDPTPTSSDQFGISAAIDGDNVFIGARGDDTNGTDVGQAHLFSVAASTGLNTIDPEGVGATDVYRNGSAVSPTLLTNPLADNLDIGTELLLIGDAATGELTTSSGGTITAGSVSIATEVGSSGMATITGSGSQWNVSGSLLVGRRDSGTLDVLDGAQVSAGSIFAGNFSTGTGTISVDGVGTDLTAAASILVGNEGGGTLSVSTSAQTTAQDDISIGHFNGSTGVLTVDNASLSVGDLFTVGRLGDGDAQLLNDAQVTTRRLIVGFDNEFASETPTLEVLFGSDLQVTGTGTELFEIARADNSRGELIVDGAGSTLTSSLELKVGLFGSASFTVQNGGTAQFTDTGLMIAEGVGSTGTATVTGTNSQLAIDGGLIVGNQGGGTLDITNGGVVDVANNGADTRIAELAGSSGAVTVDGAGSMFSNALALRVGGGTLEVTNGGAVTSGDVSNVGSTSSANSMATVNGAGSSWTVTGELRVASSGTGTLSVEDGGVVGSTTGSIGTNTNSAGIATVTGVDSTWTNAEQLLVGNAGQGVLIVEAGGVVSSTSGNLGNGVDANGTAAIRDSDSAWNMTGSLIVGSNGNGTLTVENGATVSSLTGVIGNTSTGVGDANVTGAGSLLSTTSTLTVGAMGIGEIVVENGGTLSNGSALIGRDAGSAGAVVVTGAGSTWASGGSVTVGGISTGAGGTGTLTVLNDGLVTVADNLRLWNTGTLNLNGGTIRTFNFDNSGDGVFNFDDGTLVVDGGQLLQSPTVAFAVGTGSEATQSATLTLDNSATFSANPGADVRVGVTTSGVIGIDNGSSLTQTGGGVLRVGDGVDGTVTITNNGSLSVSSRIDLGNVSGAAGNLQVSSGGAATTGQLFVGDAAGSTGSVTVSGSGATLDVSTSLEVGRQGTGVLTVEEGGVVNGGTVTTIGVFAGATGSATVIGVGSQFNAPSFLNVGSFSQGTLSVEDGGLVDAANGINIGSGFDGLSGFGDGQAIVLGTGSRLETTGTLSVGESADGSLTVEQGGQVASGDGFIGRFNGLHVSSSSVVTTRDAAGIAEIEGLGSSWQTTGDLTVGGEATGTLQVGGGGHVDVGGILRLASGSGGTGDVTVAGAGSRIDANAIIVGENGGGSLTVESGSVVETSDSIIVGATEGTEGGLLAINGGAVSVAADLFLGSGLATPGFNGVATVTSGSMLSSTTLTLDTNGVLNLQGGQLSIDFFLQSGGAFNWTDGRFTVENYDGDLTQTAGTLAAGNSPGVTNISSNYTLEPGGTLEVELAGQGGVAGTYFDFYDITGDANLNGGLIDVAPLPGFTDVIGQTYDVLTAANLTVDQSTIDRLRPEFSLSIEPGGNGSILRLTQQSLAAFDWTNPAGGDFQTAANWSGAAVPGVDRPVRFDLPETYTVTHSADSTNPWARVEAGNVMFDLGGNTQTLTSTTSNASSLFVANGASTTVVNGSIVAEEVRLAGQLSLESSGSITATSTAFNGGRLDLSGGTLTTNSFSSTGGTFNHNDGELAVVGGAFTNAAGLTLDGVNSAANPTLTLDGVDTSVFTPNTIIGNSQKGTLNLRGGTRLQVLPGGTSSITLGNLVGSAGTLNVEGAQTELDSFADFNVGVLGQGSLVVSNGGVVKNRLTKVGSLTNASSVVVDGFGSLLESEQELNIGNGSVIVSNGGQMTTSGAFLASAPSGAGSVAVIGPGSRWDSDDVIYVGGNSSGSQGIGSLTVTDSGVVSLLSTLQVWSTGRINLAGGTINAGTQLSLASGSRLTGHGDVVSPNVSSSAEITVAGGKLSLLGLSVSLLGDTVVTSSGTLETSSYSPYTDVQGGAVIATPETLGAGQVIAGYGIVLGELTGSGINLLVSNPTGTVDFRGTLDVGAETATVYSQGRPTLSGELSFLPGGQLVTPNNEYLVSSSGVIRGAADLSGQRFTGVAGSTVRAEGGLAAGPTNVLALGDASSAAGFYSNGDLIVEADANLRLDDANGAVLDSGAFVTLGAPGQGSGPSTLSAASGLTLDFGGNVQGVGTINTPNDASTPFINNGHIAGNSSAELIVLEGYVKGVGTLDNVVITGTDAPGFSPASVSRGSVEYAGTLEIEIGGTATGQFDQLNHILGEGDALLGGELVISLLDGYTPEAGDTFEFLTAAGEISGDFDIETLPAIGGGLFFDVLYNPDTVELIVAGIEGDYNTDGIVSAADYTIFRDTLGQEGSALAADGSFNNEIDNADFDVWTAAFGSSSILVSASAASAAVPEPETLLLAFFGWMLCHSQGERRRSRL